MTGIVEITIYDQASGEISRVVRMSGMDGVEPEDLPANLLPGEDWCFGAHSPDEFHFVDGWPVQKPAKPGPWAEFDKESGAWIDPRTPQILEEENARLLAAAKMRTAAAINAIRGEARKRFITDIPGQDMVYIVKERSARSYLAASALYDAGQGAEPSIDDYPAIKREIGPGLTGETAYQVASVYLYMADTLELVSSVIEGPSIDYLNRVEQATSLADLEQLPQLYAQQLQSDMIAGGLYA